MKKDERCRNCMYFFPAWASTKPGYQPYNEEDWNVVSSDADCIRHPRRVTTQAGAWCGEYKRFYPPNALDDAIDTMPAEVDDDG